MVFTGDGKGKTTSALGVALRASGHGHRVLILQFLKRKSNIGEILALSRTDLPITIRQYGRRVFFKTRTCEPMDIYRAHQGLEAFREALESQSYDLIILDEITMAVYFGLLEIEEVMRVIREKPPWLHLVLTGRKVDDALLEIADLVTEMRDIKHPFRQGIRAQEGIEY
jgi:cob(I)alamin adenosyltransferase